MERTPASGIRVSDGRHRRSALVVPALVAGATVAVALIAARGRKRDAPGKLPRRDSADLERAGEILEGKKTGGVLSSLSRWSVLSWASVLSVASAASLLSVGSFASVLSVGSSLSILSVGSSESVLSVGSARSWLGFGSYGSRRPAVSLDAWLNTCRRTSSR